jgi:hypothetical protein
MLFIEKTPSKLDPEFIESKKSSKKNIENLLFNLYEIDRILIIINETFESRPIPKRMRKKDIKKFNMMTANLSNLITFDRETINFLNNLTNSIK